MATHSQPSTLKPGESTISTSMPRMTWAFQIRLCHQHGVPTATEVSYLPVSNKFDQLIKPHQGQCLETSIGPFN